MKKSLFSVSMILGVMLIASASWALPTAKELETQVIDAYKALKSYGFMILEYENDRFWKAEQQAGRDERAGLAQSQGVDVDGVEEEEVFKKSSFELQIIKPFNLKMKIIKSDYLPNILWGGTMIYKPGDDPANYYFTPKTPPITVKQDITSETGSYLLQSWAVELIRFQQFMKNATEAKVSEGKEKITGKDCYIVEMTGLPATLKYDYNLADWGIPKEAFFKIDDEFKEKAEGGLTKVVYWFDKTSIVPVQREHFVDGEFFGRWTYNKIRLDNIVDF